MAHMLQCEALYIGVLSLLCLLLQVIAVIVFCRCKILHAKQLAHNTHAYSF